MEILVNQKKELQWRLQVVQGAFATRPVRASSPTRPKAKPGCKTLKLGF